MNNDVNPHVNTRNGCAAMSEKRKHPRIDSLNLLAYVCLNEKGEEMEHRMGRTLNVSEAGVLLETHIPVDPAHVMSLEIGLCEDMVEIPGKVAHSIEKQNGKYETGVEFYDVDDSVMKTLQKYIQAFRKQENATCAPEAD